MSKVLSFVKLDFITVKPYLTIKNLSILLLVIVVLSMNNTGDGVLIGVIMAFALMYSSYPFAVGEKSGIDQLYSTLPMSKHCVVRGRYGFVLALDIISGIVACVLLFAVQTARRQTVSFFEMLLTTLVLFVVYTFFQAIQLPIYFKHGYTKAKFLAYMPIAIFPLVTVAIGSRFSDADLAGLVNNVLVWISDNQLFVIAVSAIVWVAVMLISYTISLKFYKKREF